MPISANWMVRSPAAVIIAAMLWGASVGAGPTEAAGTAPPSTRPSNIFDLGELDRLSDEVWKESGPFGIFLQDEVSHESDRMNVDPTSWVDLAFYSVLKSGDTEIYFAAITMFSGGKPHIAFLVTRGKYGDRSKIVTDTELLRGASASVSNWVIPAFATATAGPPMFDSP